MKKLLFALLFGAIILPGLSQKMFLNMAPLIKGESTDPAHKDWIDVKAYSMGFANSFNYESGGVGGGKVSLQDMSLSLCLDRSLNDLKKALFKTARIPRVEFDITTGQSLREGATPVFYKMILTDVVLTSVQEGGAADTNEKVSVNISLQYKNIRMEYYQPDPKTGIPDKSITNEATYDRGLF